ncbi:uncharacterized protein [Clytia hemisphaerica]|uniref:Chromo domain-containing protein n=2 Tax=Clytia hemisphaerica TaxID=252671 RepID=A0A7M5US65_9CNID
MSTKVKIVKTAQQIETLESFFQKGMTSYGRDNVNGLKLLDEAVKETGLTETIVKEWIRNKKKAPSKKKTEKVNERNPRGYDLFKSKWLTDNPNSSLREANIAWKELVDEEKLDFNKRASEIEEVNFHDKPVEWQKKKISLTRKKILDLCKELEGYGVETLVMEVDTDRARKEPNFVLTYGSERALDFSDQQSDLDWEFASFINGCSEDERAPKSERNEVANLLNQKFLSLKTGRTRVPYKRLKDGTIDVHGLPDGFELRKPASCTKRELAIIKDHINNISFTIPSVGNKAAKSGDVSDPVPADVPAANVTADVSADVPAVSFEVVNYNSTSTVQLDNDLDYTDEVSPDSEISTNAHVTSNVAPRNGKNKSQNIVSGGGGGKRRRKDMSGMDPIYSKLGDDDLVPNTSSLEVSKKKVLELAANGEGLVERIDDHKEEDGHTTFYVKWIGFKDPSWLSGDAIKIDLKDRYFASLDD